MMHKIGPGFDKAGTRTRCLRATGHQNIKNTGLGLLILLAVALLPCNSQAQIQLLRSGANGLTLKSTTPQYQFRLDSLGVQHLQAPPPFAALYQSGQPQLPQWSAALAAPPGAVLRLKVDAGTYREIEGIDLGLFDSFFNDKNEDKKTNADLKTDAEGFWPAQRADTAYLGSLRGTPSHSLRLFPFSYNIARRTLRVYESLQVQVDFARGSAKTTKNADRHKAAPHKKDPHSATLRSGLLNAADATSWTMPTPTAKVAQNDWYYSHDDWVKVWVEEDGIHRIDAQWLERRLIDPAGIDPQTFRLFYLGQEIPLHLDGAEDGRFDPQDHLLFYGRYRRDDRDYESLYGRRNTYWLTWGGQNGKRFTQHSGAPTNSYPQSVAYRDTAHFEEDLFYQTLPSAPDNDRDHWFWNNVEARNPDAPSGRNFAVELDGLYDGHPYQARVRLALHGAADLGHHSLLKINGETVDERIWGGRGEGQVELLIEKDMPSSIFIADEVNRVLFQLFADQEKWDVVYFNWFELEYLRRYRAQQGFIAFEEEPDPGRRVAIQGFNHPQIELFDVANGLRFTQVEINPVGDFFSATFEDAPDKPAAYVAADSLGLRIPGGTRDFASDWRPKAGGADYLIITPRRFQPLLETLAQHRRQQGLQVEIATVEDLYDEFSYGRFTSQALQDFIAHTYRNWTPQPAYVLLAGDTHYDYRNRLGSERLDFVPSRYYHARRQGQSPSDVLYALLDGDDLLPDLAIGRLAAGNSEQMRTMVNKIIAYDTQPPPGVWRDKAVFLANPHQSSFIDPSNHLASQFTEPLGIESVKIYNETDSFLPNADSKAFIDALNEGALVVNYNGHGSPQFMENYFLIGPEWDFLAQIQNRNRLPLMVALSCLNGQFANPKVDGLGEVFTRRAEGGVIAHISATAKSFIHQNNLMSERLFDQLFVQDNLAFGPALNAAKVQTFAAHPAGTTVLRTMVILGDPAQKLALPLGADYAAESLSLSDGQAFSRDTMQLEALLRNYARPSADSLEIAFIAHSPQSAQAETLFFLVEPAFADERLLRFDWPVGTRLGAYDLELLVDPRNLVREADKDNNGTRLQVDILEPILPLPVFPGPEAVLDPGQVRLEAAVPPDAVSTYQFELAADSAFAPQATLRQSVESLDGMVALDPEGLPTDLPYFWRLRAAPLGGFGPWSETRSFSIDSAEDSVEVPRWRQSGSQLGRGAGPNLVNNADGLRLSETLLPPRPEETTREDGFTVRGQRIKGTGVLATDGTYLYVKRWFNDDSTVYPGSDFFARIGTGFNGSVRGRDYGDLADSTTAGVSATYHSDSYIYNESGRAFELERIDARNGRLDTVAVPTGLLHWQTGRIEDGHSLITSDGRYIYNVAAASERGVRTEWSVRVLDPASDWQVVRQFTSPPTETGFTFRFTDGIVADGKHLYFIEYGEQQRIRMVDAFDGTLIDEWRSDQDVTRIIGGQYDWINDKVWLGDLLGSAVFRYSGYRPIESGTVASLPLGPVSTWDRARLDGEGAVDFWLESLQDGVWTALDGFGGLTLNSEIDLNSINANQHPQLRLAARLQQGAQLRSWEADFEPLPSLALKSADASGLKSGLRLEASLRNLSADIIEGARLLFERDDREGIWAETALAPLGRGELRRVVLDSLPLPPAGTKIKARLVGPAPDAVPGDESLDVPLLLPDRLPLALSLRRAGHAFLSGDPLPPNEHLLVDAPAIEGAAIELRLDGAGQEADSVLAADNRLQILFASPFDSGEHELEVQLVREGEVLGAQQIRFLAGGTFSLTQVLPYPHPMQENTDFTFVLSQPATVRVEVYTLSGRRVCSLERQVPTAGFTQVAWDGRSDGGERVANGTYLYIVRATGSGNKKAFKRGTLLVAR